VNKPFVHFTVERRSAQHRELRDAIVTVKELLAHSTVLVTMRYLHPNLESKAQVVAKLAANCDNSTTVRTQMQQSVPRVSQIGC